MDKTIHRKFIQALPSDNPYLSEEYIEVLKETFAHRPELLEAYLYGSWDALEGAEQIIKNQWLREAKERTIIGLEARPRLICDTARFGDDETVIYYSETTDIDAEIYMSYCRTTEISSKMAAMSYEHHNCPCVVEATGGDLGAGVVDELVAQGKIVIVFNPQGKADDPKLYYNVRAEAWSKGARKLSKGEVQLHHNDPRLRTQLCVPTYKFRAGKTLVESKADIKSRLGQSPDRADCYIILLWSYDKVQGMGGQFSIEDLPQESDIADSYSMRTNL